MLSPFLLDLLLNIFYWFLLFFTIFGDFNLLLGRFGVWLLLKGLANKILYSLEFADLSVKLFFTEIYVFGLRTALLA